MYTEGTALYAVFYEIEENQDTFPENDGRVMLPALWIVG